VKFIPALKETHCIVLLALEHLRIARVCILAAMVLGSLLCHIVTVAQETFVSFGSVLLAFGAGAIINV
jgi:hypothetical protein